MANSPYSQEYPLGTPSVSGNNLTVDLMLKEPTRINAYLSDLALKQYFAERIFTNGGGVSGGALVYNQLVANDLFPTRATQRVAPGAEFPEVTFDRPEPKTAQVEKLGGKFRVTDEARDRNDLTAIQSEATKLGNDIPRQLHVRALAELEASITAIGSDVQMTTTSWADAAALTLTTTNSAAMPTADFANLRKLAAVKELGVTYNLLIVNPQERANFEIIYQGNGPAVLAANGLSMIVSNQVAAGTAYAVQEGTVGQVRYEQPLQTVSWRDDATESSWVQASIRSVFAVTNPYNAVKLSGLAA
ncbi:major capsid protein [Nocardia australiensis]|uniref:major capsid protein n=1 Tax=Nocardia australiensis TaxID=2887191 RepID=UPI001D137749|nr:major capsid protein [Nocardia australiensis]